MSKSCALAASRECEGKVCAEKSSLSDIWEKVSFVGVLEQILLISSFQFYGAIKRIVFFFLNSVFFSKNCILK